MLDILSDYLDMATTPEDKVKVENAFELFERIELEDYEYAFEEIVYTEEEVDAGATLSAIINLTSSLLRQLLRDFSIEMSEDAGLELLTDMLNGLLDLENHEERSAIEQTCNLEIPVREVLCELLTFTTRYSVDELLPYVVDVSAGLFTRLVEEGAESASEDEDVALDRKNKLHAFRLYDIWLDDGAPARLREMIKQGVDVGMPYLVYASVIGNDFEQMEPAIIAEEMFGMALISCDGSSRPAETIKENLEQFIANTDTITAVMARVSLLVTGFKP